MSWQKVRIGDFLKRRKDAIEIKNSVEYNRITIKTKHQGVFLRNSVKGSLIGTKLQFTVKAGQFLLSKIDARLGAFGILPDELNGAIITGNFWAFDVDNTKVNIDWFNLFTSSGNFYEICNQASSGTTHRKYLDETKFLNFAIDLPDINEQNRFINKYESYYRSYKKIEAEIENQQSHLQQLRQAILQEAVQGKLTKQNKGDEPADKLLQRIKTEKQKLIAAGKLKKEKELPSITEDEIPFKLPKGWVWCRLAEVCDLITDGTHLTPKYVDKGRIFLSAQNVKPFRFIPDIHRFVSEEDYQGYIKSRKAEKGDVLLTRVGAGIGEAAVIDIDIDFAFYVSLGLLKPNKSCIYPKYLELFLNSPLGRGHSSSNTLGKGVSAGNLNLSLIRNFEFPFPPYKEQHHIVAKVEKLMQMVNKLEKQVEQSQAQAQKLLQAVLKEAFSNSRKEYEMNDVVTMAAE